MKEGDVVLTRIPQADGRIKNRPAIILREMPPYKDFLVCGVSTQIDKQLKGFDEVIFSSDDVFAASGLKATSLVRLGFLAVLPSAQIIGAIGSRHQTLLQSLSSHLLQSVTAK